jgi:lipopolysaccharide/colanic/teichoic acid biosynthesis glycosyltransferase
VIDEQHEELSDTNRDILAPSLIDAMEPDGKGWYLRAKIGIEWMLAVILTILLAPLLLILALLVRLTSDGAAFYKQPRLGCRGRVFQIYKLRTMVKDAEAGTGPVWAAKEDRRITYVGAILRKAHLDELPQLINVIKGEMSLIGPRPERPEIAARISHSLPGFCRRLAMRPGITGLAQILLPADDPHDTAMTCARRKLECDMTYIREAGFLLDLKIYVCTVCQLVCVVMDSICGGFLGPYKREVANIGSAAEESGELEGVKN